MVAYSSRWLLPACLLAAGCFVCAGCGNALETVPVSGKVTYKGEPVKSGTISFSPQDGDKGRAATAGINEDGTYQTSPDKGVTPGQYTVSIRSYKRAPRDIPPAELATLGDSNWAVPKKYTDPKTSGLTVTVEESDSSKTADFDLTD